MDIEILSLKFFDYSSFIRGYSSRTIDRYKKAIVFYCKVAQVSKIEEITEENLRKFFMYGRVERNWRPNTYIGIYRSLTVFFNWCIENKYMAENPIKDMELPKVEKRLPPKLTKQEAFKFLEMIFNYPYDYKFLRYRNHAIFSMFIFAGLRKSELLNLKLTDVDIENLTIFVSQGKGAKDRMVPMSYTLAQSLKRYLVERKRLNKTCPEFFASLNRNIGFTADGMNWLVYNLQKVSKVKFSIHKLRHTFATLMLEGGCDIYSLSRMMGHSDIKTTTIYLSASAEHLRSQMIKHPLNNFNKE